MMTVIEWRHISAHQAIWIMKPGDLARVPGWLLVHACFVEVRCERSRVFRAAAPTVSRMDDNLSHVW